MDDQDRRARVAADLAARGAHWAGWNGGQLHSYRELDPDPDVHGQQVRDEHLLAARLLEDDRLLVGGVIDFMSELELATVTGLAFLVTPDNDCEA